MCCFFFKQKTAYDMRISDLSSDVCSSDLAPLVPSDIQRERMELFDVFEAPHNLPVAAFAKMAGKSRRWISYEIKAGNLLALNVGNRGQRVPDWHLDPLKHELIQRSEEHTSELQSLMRISSAVFCLKKKK